MENLTQIILLKAIRVHNYGNGVVGVEVPGATLSEEDSNTLRRLFPHLTEEAYTLLSKEALLANLFTGSFPQNGQHDIIELDNPVKDMKKRKYKDTSRYVNEDGERVYPSEEGLPRGDC